MLTDVREGDTERETEARTGPTAPDNSSLQHEYVAPVSEYTRKVWVMGGWVSEWMKGPQISIRENMLF